MLPPPPPPPDRPELPEGAAPPWPAWYAGVGFLVALIATLIVPLPSCRSSRGLRELISLMLMNAGSYTRVKAMALTPDCHVVAIASGGCNILSYLTADPARITATSGARFRASAGS